MGSVVVFVPCSPCCAIHAHHISGSRCNALPTCHIRATDSSHLVLQWCQAAKDSAAFSMMLDDSSQSKEQKWFQPTWKQNKELFVNTFLTINWSLVIKIACVDKRRQDKSGARTIAIYSLSAWLYAFMSGLSDLSSVAIDPGISLRTPSQLICAYKP